MRKILYCRSPCLLDAITLFALQVSSHDSSLGETIMITMALTSNHPNNHNIHEKTIPKLIEMKILSQGFTLIYLCSIASAERVVRVLFNKGLTPAQNEYCNSTSDVLILDLLFNQTSRRNLRVHSEINHENIREINTERQLYPIYCKTYCLGYVKGTCRVTNCKGYRRELTYPTDDSYNVTCTEKIGLMNKTLNTLINSNAVSPPCQRLLQKQRIFECFDDTTYGEIEHIKVTKAFEKNATVLNKPDQALAVCKNSSTLYQIEVGVNLCVETLVATATGPSGKTDTYPFGARFPHTFVWWFTPKVSIVNVGSYVYNYIPDGIVSKSKSLVIDVKNC
jgi:hypothetical protein